MASTQRHRTRPVLLTGGASGAVVAASALALTLAASSTPAFAVTVNSDATVTVTIHDLAGVAGEIRAAKARRWGEGRAGVSGCTATVRPEPEYHLIRPAGGPTTRAPAQPQLQRARARNAPVLW